MKKFADFIKESKYFENTRIVVMTKELATKYLEDIKELNIKESSNRKDFNWREWTDDDILCDLELKWETSLLVFVDNKLIGFQVNHIKHNVYDKPFAYTNRILIDSEYRNYKLLWELYQKFFTIIKNLEIEWCGCFTPFDNVKDLNVNLLGYKVINVKNILDIFGIRYDSVDEEGRIQRDQLPYTSYFMVKYLF